tara:strand:+ start:213 stop:506 length:294 start_codon:yes stop_codon:yes gene_type:complete
MMEVKLLRVITGEELVAEIIDENAAEVVLKNALVVIPTQQSVGFAPWATVIDRENPEVTVSRTHIVYIANLDESIRNKYDEIYGSKLVKPEKKSLIL